VIVLQSVDRLFAAIMGGFLVGVGLLMIIRHKASLGGLGVLALYLAEHARLAGGQGADGG
jgi:uncharacterized membrane-anchored protein YitT (DUF2179 family)